MKLKAKGVYLTRGRAVVEITHINRQDGIAVGEITEGLDAPNVVFNWTLDGRVISDEAVYGDPLDIDLLNQPSTI